MTSQERILRLAAFPQSSYESIDLNRLTTYVISALTEMNIPTSIENIAVASFLLFPAKFQMCNYPQFPDMSRTNRALLQLRPKYRGWATGSVKRGFILNGAGEQIARRTREALNEAAGLCTAAPEERTLREAGRATIDVKRRLQDVRDSECYVKYTAGQDTRGLDFLDLLNAYSHTPPDKLARSLKDLEGLAKDECDDDLPPVYVPVVMRVGTMFTPSRFAFSSPAGGERSRGFGGGAPKHRHWPANAAGV